MTWHIIERFFTHLFMGCSFVLIGTFLLDLLNRKKKWSFLPRCLESMVLLSALLTLPLIFLREPWDIGVGGDPWQKSLYDYASWFLGVGLPSWGLIRLVRRAKRETFEP